MDDLNRRAFLRGAGLAFAGVVGAASFAAGQQEQEEDEKSKSEESQEELDYDALFGEDTGDEDTRACPQCGALMYRQGRTWTCENCGYSYVE